QDTLKKTQGNQSKAAKLLLMPLTTLRYKIKKYGL
ncbi:MAG: Fis family transcriptional regulator, partial [Calditrichaeota bacterium]